MTRGLFSGLCGLLLLSIGGVAEASYKVIEDRYWTFGVNTPTESGSGGSWFATIEQEEDWILAPTRAQVYQVMGSASSSITELGAGGTGTQVFRTEVDSGGAGAQFFSVTVWAHVFGHGSVSSNNSANSRARWSAYSWGGYLYGTEDNTLLDFSESFDIPTAGGATTAEEEVPLDYEVDIVSLTPSDPTCTAFTHISSGVPEVSRSGAHEAGVTLGSKAYGAVDVQ